jgi:hypothetical protein
MNTERRISNPNRIELEHVVRIGFRHYWGAVILLTAGLILSILAGSLFPIGIVLAAPEEDVPCKVCPEASDPVQYTHLAARPAKAREAGAASASGLAVGDVSDAVQYAFLAARSAAVRGSDCALLALSARSGDAEAARLTGLAEWYVGGEFAVAGAPRLDRARSAEAARLTALAAYLDMGPDEVSPAVACLAGL